MNHSLRTATITALSAAVIAPAPALAQAHGVHHSDHQTHQAKIAKHHHGTHHRLHHRKHHRTHHRVRGPLARAASPTYNRVGAGALAPIAAAKISGTAYYVSPSGSDANSGLSPAQAWKTVARANRASLKPGDGVLFQGGATFSDSTLMPNVSGTAGAPIVFGSYGDGRAAIPMGVWFISHDYLTFDDLALGPDGGFHGGRDEGTTANHITVQRCLIGMGGANDGRVGLYAFGDDWTILGNTVENTGDSGLLVLGDTYTISGNTIENTGLDSAIPYGKHGIYLKASNAVVSDNTITHFSADGISQRYRDSTISDNYIADGSIGLGFFEYDTVQGKSHWTGNTITGTSAAGMYVTKDRAALIESFVISGNTIKTAGQPLNLTTGAGTYRLTRNSLGHTR